MVFKSLAIKVFALFGKKMDSNNPNSVDFIVPFSRKLKDIFSKGSFYSLTIGMNQLILHQLTHTTSLFVENLNLLAGSNFVQFYFRRLSLNPMKSFDKRCF